MEAKEVKNMKWIHVADWGELGKTHVNYRGDIFVREADVEIFVENVLKNVAWDLNIPYTELEPILKEENSDFYARKEILFDEYSGISDTHPKLIELEKMFIIPDVTMAPDIGIQSNVERFLTYFSALSDREKMEVLQRLGAVS